VRRPAVIWPFVREIAVTSSSCWKDEEDGRQEQSWTSKVDCVATWARVAPSVDRKWQNESKQSFHDG
jgi:hypothetical protein